MQTAKGQSIDNNTNYHDNKTNSTSVLHWKLRMAPRLDVLIQTSYLYSLEECWQVYKCQWSLPIFTFLLFL